MLCKQVECNGIVYTIESFSNQVIICWYTRTNVIMLECDYNKKSFVDSTIYHSYYYHGRCYDRRKPRNRSRYLYLKAAIPDKVYKAAIEYMFD